MKKIDFHIHTKQSSWDAPFEFCQSKLDEYVSNAELDCIAVTNHNLFDKSQFEKILDKTEIPVFPGIEVNLEEGHILVISDGDQLDDFNNRCAQVFAKCNQIGDYITIEVFKSIFGDLGRYILIPHYDKKPRISAATLGKLTPFVTAGEVASPKKFIYCANSSEGLVPLYFSDCRIKQELEHLPTRQTYLDCSEVSFGAIREVFRDRGKVVLSEDEGNNLFRVFEDGLHLSTGLNVVLGERSSGKSHTLSRISKVFGAENIHYIKQFDLVTQNEDEDNKKFKNYLNEHQSLFSKDYLSDLQHVIEDMIDVDINEDHRAVDKYINTLLEYAKETKRHNAFSKAKIYSENPFLERDSTGLLGLIDSTKNLISNQEYRDAIDKHIDYADLTALFISLIKLYYEQEQNRLKMSWVNSLTQDIKEKLQLKSAVPKISDIDLYKIALNKRKVQKFDELVKKAREPRTPLRKQKRSFEVVAQVGVFKGAGELKKESRSNLRFSEAYKTYDHPYKYLQELRELGDPVTPADFSKYFVRIDYRILNKDGLEASGGERSEFFLLDEIDRAISSDMLLIDEPESSFGNRFLKEDVNEMIKEISKKMPVVLVTHNNTVGASISPDYLLYTNKEIEDGEIKWRVYSGHPTSKELTSPDGETISTWEVMLGCLEAGSVAYEERRTSYENLKNR